MRFGEIIKKAWHITWHYRWLWILGVFAGITGGSSGGGGGSGSYGRSFGSGRSTGSGTSGLPSWSSIQPVITHWLPFALIVVALLFLIGIAFAVIGIGARGGLVWAVNEIEEGRSPRLGEAWNAGFARFWRLFGLGLVLQLPLAVAGLLLAALILVPIVGPLMRGSEPNVGLVLAPMCGVLAVGVPVLIVAAVVLGIMYVTGTRFIVLNDMRTMHAAGEGWHMFRARLGDHVVMYFISLGLSVVAGFALAIPIVVLALATIIPAGVAAAGKNWGLFAGMLAIFAVLVFILSLAFSGIWGTFTSAMWTVFFRRLIGREVLVSPQLAYPPPPVPVAVPPMPAPPSAPAYTPPPMAYTPPAPPQDMPHE